MLSLIVLVQSALLLIQAVATWRLATNLSDVRMRTEMLEFDVVRGLAQHSSQMGSSDGSSTLCQGANEVTK